MNILNTRISQTSVTAVLSGDAAIYGSYNTQVTFTMDPSTVSGYYIAALVYQFGDAVKTVHRIPGVPAPYAPTAFEFTDASTPFISGSVTAYDATWQPIFVWGIIYYYDTYDTLPAYKLLETQSTDTDNTVIVVGETFSTINSVHLWTSLTQEPTAVTTDETLEPIELEIASVSISAVGTPLSSEGSLIFIANQGDATSPIYSSIAAAVSSLDATNVVFCGGNNLPSGTYSTFAANWAGYSGTIAASAAWPVLGASELQSSQVSDAVVSLLLTTGSDWRYETDTASVTSTWVDVASATSAWATGDAPIGYGFTPLGTEISSTHAGCTTTPVTAMYAQSTFTYTPGNGNVVRIRTINHDGALVYLNDELIGGNDTNLYDLYAPCTRDANGSAVYTTRYAPLSTLNTGTNTISVKVVRSPNNEDHFGFDAEVSTVTSSNLVVVPAYYGAPQYSNSLFAYASSQVPYYTKMLDGDVQLFVLDVSRRVYGTCSTHPQSYGVTVASDQYQWFADQLASSTARWKIVALYDPYESSLPPDTTNSAVTDWGFGAHGIDLVVVGSSLGINEHLIIGDMHVVVLGVGTLTPASVNTATTSPYKVWQDVTALTSPYGGPALAYVAADPLQLTVSIKRADAFKRTLHQFAIT